MISAICCHYGRTWLLPEAVESFRRQNFMWAAELIIVNDHPAITIEVDTAEFPPRRTVKVINLPKRCETISDKFDLGVQVAKNDLCVMWDDDDLSLPHRLTATVGAHEHFKEAAYIAYDRHFYCDNRGPHEVARGIHGGDSFKRGFYLSVNGSQGDGHNDQNFVAKAKDTPGAYTVVTPYMPFYLYRWQGICGHHSLERSVESAMARFDKEVRAHRCYREGAVRIVPSYTVRTEGLVAMAERMARGQI